MTAPSITTLVRQDTFTGTDATLLDAHALDLGGAWTRVGSYPGRMRLRSNKVRPEAGSGEASQWSAYTNAITPAGNAYRIKASITVPSSLSSISESNIWLLLEDSTDSAGPYRIELVARSAEVSASVIGGAYGDFTDFFSFKVNSVAAAGATFVVELIVLSNVESWFLINGVEVDHRVLPAGASAPTQFSINGYSAPLNTQSFTVDYVEVYTGTVAVPTIATGFSSTAFGTPITPFAQTGEATGASTTAFGPVGMVRPGYITDAVTGALLLHEFVKSPSSPHTDPLTAYAAWAAEIGGSDTTLAGLSDGDSIVTTSFPTLNGGDAWGSVRPGSEGSLGLELEYYPFSAAGRWPLTAEAGSGQISVTRFYTPSRAPNVILTFSDPTLDMERRNGKHRTVGTVSVFYVRWADSTWTKNVEAAFRLSFGRIEVVAQSNAGNTGDFYFQVWRAISTQVAPVTLPVLTKGGGGAYIDPLVAGTTQHYVSEGLSVVLANASGFSTTALGLPSQPHPAASIGAVTQFGAAAGFERFPAVGFASPALPTAYWRHNETSTVSGGTTTKFGSPSTLLISPPGTTALCAAYGATATALGAPAASWPQTAAATGAASTTLGTASALRSQLAAGASATALGLPGASARTTRVASGARATAFGTASKTATTPPRAAASAGPTALFGTARSLRPTTYVASGLAGRQRFGRPVAGTSMTRVASGANTTALGPPSSTELHYALHIPPGTVFGTPLLHRDTTC